MAKKKTIAVDLDGTLAQYGEWKGDDVIGDPIPAMVSRLEKEESDGATIVVFTTRGDVPARIKPVKAWLKEHGLPAWEVTNIKKPTYTEMWDDRARRVQKNTGRFE